MGRAFNIYFKYVYQVFLMLTFVIAIKALTDNKIALNPFLVAINAVGLYLWYRDMGIICLMAGYVLYFAISITNQRFRVIYETIEARQFANSIMTFDFVVNKMKENNKPTNMMLSMMYLTTPMYIGYIVDGVLDKTQGLLAKFIFLFILSIIVLVQHMICSLSASLTVHNQMIAKLLYPMLCKKEIRNRILLMKVEAFICRLNNEYVGFRCLYFMKFKKVTFYNYMIGISGTYFLVNELNREVIE